MESKIQERMPELHQTCGSVADSFSKHMDAHSLSFSKHIDALSKRMDDGFDRILAELHRMLLVRGLPIPPRRSPSLLQPQSSSFSYVLPVRKDDPPIDVRQEQLQDFSLGESEFEQSVHSFKDNMEERATQKGEFPTPILQRCVDISVLIDSITGVKQFGGNFNSQFCEIAEKHILRIDFVGQTESVMVQLQSKCSHNYAPQLFDERSERKSDIVDVSLLENSRGKLEFKNSTVGATVSLVFDLGGRNHDRYECESQFVHKGIVRSNACNVFDEMLDPESKALTEMTGLLLQFESYTPIVFDPGGSFLLFKSHIIQRKIWNWKLECMGIQEEFACWVKESELGADCRKFTLLQWDPGGFILVKLGQQPKFVSHEDPGGRLTAEVKFITLNLSGIESHVLVRCSTKPSTVDAPNLFEELPDLKAIRCLVDVLQTEVGGRNNLEVLSIPKSFDHVGGLVKLIFDPGGQITKEVEMLELN